MILPLIFFSKKFFSQRAKKFILKEQKGSDCRTISQKYICILEDSAKDGILVQNATISGDKAKIRYIQTIGNNERVIATAFKEKIESIDPEIVNLELTPMNGMLPLETINFRGPFNEEITNPEAIKENDYAFQPFD